MKKSFQAVGARGRNFGYVYKETNTCYIDKPKGNKNIALFFHYADPQGITEGGLPGIPTQL